MNRKYMQNISSSFRWKLLFFLITILGCQSYSYGQSSNGGNPIDTEALFKNQMVNTPATAALKQNIVYPVNYSTGLPEIKIPLYEVKNGDVVLPIYLTYHASGIKLSDVAGWVGLGWNLVAEPMITRTIRGWVDNPRTMTCDFNKNDFRKRFPDYVKNLTSVSIEEPDEYYYRLPDKQGMFMYAMEPVDKSRNFLPIPYENIRIDWTGDYFQITDDDGAVYKFAGGRETGEGNSNPIGWKASAIVASNKRDSISFVYDNRKVAYRVNVHDDYIIVRDGFSIKKEIYTNRKAMLQLMDYTPDECMQDPIIISRQNNVTYGFQSNADGELFSDGTEPDRSTSGRHISTQSQLLSEICFDQGKVIFTKDSKFPRIQKITVYDCNGNFVKDIRFNYYTPNDRVIQRYFLESLVMVDKNGEVKETYLFGYEHPNRLPDPGNRSIDYWGYFNGVYRPDSVTLVPRQTIEVTRWKYRYVNGYIYPLGIESAGGLNVTFGSELSREPDEEYMKYGTLSSITYPAGSTDEFIYEAHRYRDEEGNIKQAGGLRIKQIQTRSAEGRNTKVRTFTYSWREDGCGTPLTASVLDYFRLVQGVYLCELFNEQGGRYAPIANEYGTARHRTFFSNPTRPITFAGGTSVMYDYVTEYNGTPENNSGKTIYEYAIDRTHPMPEDQNTMRCDRHDGWMYGQLLGKIVYRNDNGQYTPLEEIANGYIIPNKEYGRILTGEASADNIIRESSLNQIPEEARRGYSYRRTEITVRAKLPLWSRHTFFTEGGKVSTNVKYEYSDSSTTYPTRIIETGSDGIEHITNLSYPQNYGDIFPYTEMVERNILSPVVKKEHIRNGQYLEVETPYSVPFINVYKPENVVIRRSASEKGDTRFTYIYDDYGRKCQETKGGKENVVYLYGYSNQYVIALIENATYEEVVAKLGGKEVVKNIAAAKSPSMYNIDKLRQSLPSAHVTTYAYKPLVGVASVTNPMGLTTCYEYDDLGRLIKTYIINGNRHELIERSEYNYANQ